MNYRLLFLVALVLIVCTVPVSAATINISVVSFKAGVSVGDVEAFTDTGDSGNPFTFDVKSGNTLDASTFETQTEASYSVLCWFADGSEITTSYWFTSNSPLTGTATMSMGGNTTTFLYYKVPATPLNGPIIMMRPIVLQAGIDPTSHTEYLVASNTIDLPANNGAFYQFDSNDAAYVPLNTRLSVNPIVKIQTSTDFGQFTVSGETISVANYAAAEYEAETKPRNTLLDQFGLGVLQTLTDNVMSTVTALNAAGKAVAEFLSELLTLSTFIMASGLFIGLNAVYVALAILLSIAESDDMIYSFSKFMRYMRKLLRFYIELWKAIKELIVWW